MIPEGWSTFRELDARAARAKGSAFRLFKSRASRWREGRDFVVLEPECDARVIDALRRAGRIYGGTRNAVLLAPAVAAILERDLAPDGSTRVAEAGVRGLRCPLRTRTPESRSMNAVELLTKLPAAFQPEAAGDTDCTVQFNISSPMHIVIKNGSCATHEGAAGAADVTITMDDDDLVSLMKGELNGMTAFMTGKLQLEGDLMLAQRMFSFFDSSKLG